MAESIIEYACRVQDKRNGLDPDALEGRRQARELLLEVLAEIDLPACWPAGTFLLAALRRRGVG